MNIDTQELQKYNSTLKHYKRKIRQIEEIEQQSKKENSERNNEIYRHFKNKMKSFSKKLSEIQINFTSAKRRIKNISSLISDYGFMAEYFDNKYLQIDLPNPKNTNSKEIEIMKEIIKKKEKKYTKKLKLLETEKINLKQKKTELTFKKIELERRFEQVCSLINGISGNANYSENQISYSNMMQSFDTKDSFDSYDILYDTDVDEFSQQEDLIIQQLQVQELQLNELIMTNQIKKEKLESKSNEIRLLKNKIFSIQQIKCNNQKIDKISDNEQNYSSEQYSEEDYQEQYEQLLSKQQKIDEENKAIDLLIAQNNKLKSETEANYEQKLKQISALSDQSSEIDKLKISIHKLNDEIIEANDKLSQLDLTKKRFLRQNANAKSSIEKLQKIKEELAKRQREAEAKKKNISEKDINLKNRLRQYEENLLFIDSQINELNNKKEEVDKLDFQASSLDEKIKEANEEIKRLSDLVDKLILSVSSNRANSRLSRLQEMMGSKSDLQINSGSDNTFYSIMKRSSSSNDS